MVKRSFERAKKRKRAKMLKDYEKEVKQNASPPTSEEVGIRSEGKL